MYHYCRPIASSRWPRIRGLELADFKSQLAYLRRNYTIVSLPEVISALDGGELPDNACLLTFDDGYLDHYQHVFPLLFDAKVSGAFFPIGRSVAERWVADVNKIHLILHEGGLPWLVGRCQTLSGESPGAPGRFDDADTAFVKRVLQRAPAEEIAGLFQCIVTDEYDGDIASELYMTPEHIKVMAANGMHFGVHGWNHVRFSRMTTEEQAADLDASIAFLRSLGVLPERWAMCYPYGAPFDYDRTTRTLLAQRGCVAAFTTDSSVTDMAVHARCALPRLDTNDVPRG